MLGIMSEQSRLQRVPFQEAEPVLIVDDRGRQHLLHLQKGYKSHHGRTGRISHDDIIGEPPGLQCITDQGREFVCLRLTLEEFVLQKLKRHTQVIYPKDMGMIVVQGNLFSGARVLEAGLGSASLTILLRSLLGPDGYLVSYERRPEFVEPAESTLALYGKLYGEPLARHRIAVRDVYEGIDETDLDTVLLDVPEPQQALGAAASALRINGVLVCWLPTALQVFELVRALQTSAEWARVRSSETLLRPWRVGPRSIRPAQRMVGHTGFLISARRVERTEIKNV